jgi:molybdopterin-guanine dinucleotide biosynthesis protein A
VAGAVVWCLAATEPPDVLISVAVDTPFLPPDFAATLLAALQPDDDALVASYGEQDYPTNAIWRLSALAPLPESIGANTAPHSLKRLAATLRARRIVFPDSQGGDPFTNANTPADRAALEARAARRNGASTMPDSALGKAG